MPFPAFVPTSPASRQGARRRVTALVAGAATVTGVLVALAVPASAAARGTGASVEDGGGGFSGSGGRACLEPALATVTA